MHSPERAGGPRPDGARKSRVVGASRWKAGEEEDEKGGGEGGG